MRQVLGGAVLVIAGIAGALMVGCGGGTTTNTTVVAPPGSTGVTYRVPAGSMEPTLTIGQQITVAPLTTTPHVGDIVVFHPPLHAERQVCGVARPRGSACPQPESNPSSVLFIKRIVAGPGDVISIVEGHVIRNGTRESDPYIRQCATAPDCSFPTPIKIPADHWFMLGDNRGESDDSRFWGPVPTRWIVGVVGSG
jgi:signal peptidase I